VGLAKITLRPGINKQLTATQNEGGYTDGNWTRFRDGLPQPVGGWAKTVAATFQGMCRGLHAWTTLAGTQTMGLGTHLRLYIFQSAFADVTPVRTTIATTNPYSTTSGSPTVTVTATAHGAAPGDFVELPSSSAVGGLTLVGEYTVVTVPNANTFTITAASNATSTASGGGSVTLTFLISVGLQDCQLGGGWGAGAWGAGTWGTSRAGNGVTQLARVWSLDNWGQDMMAAPRGGGLYGWSAASGPSVRAAALANAPLYNNAILTALPERHLISFGAETGGTLDPMLVRWSDTENNAVWTATANNAAGSFRLAGGNQIMTGLAGPGEILVWTDTVLYAMRFEGYPYIYGFYQLGANCGLIAPHAAIVLGGVAFWMSPDRFMTYAGQTQPLHCDVWDAIFRDSNPLQTWKIYAFTNASFTEVGWAYCSTNSTEIDSCVVYDMVGNTWWTGSYAGMPASRTAWEDLGTFANPIAAGTDGHLYSHEFGQSADGAALGDYVQSGFFDIADGEPFSFLDQIIPDFGDQTGSVAVTVSGQYFPNGKVTTKGPYNVTPSTRYLSPRLRGRQIALRIASVGIGTFYRLGAVRARITADGRQ
jgi:hypothetical protein